MKHKLTWKQPEDQRSAADRYMGQGRPTGYWADERGRRARWYSDMGWGQRIGTALAFGIVVLALIAVWAFFWGAPPWGT